MRKSYSGKLKAKIAVEVIREQDTLAEISSKFEVHRVLLSRWKKEAINGLPEIFSKKSMTYRLKPVDCRGRERPLRLKVI